MSQIEEKQRKRRVVLDRLYDRLPVNEEVRDVSTEDFAGDGIHPQATKDYIREMVDAGILSRRMEYGTPANRMSPGRHFHYTLLLSPEDARRTLAALDQQNIIDTGRNRKVAAKKVAAKKRSSVVVSAPVVTEGLAVTVRAEEPVEAIVGPDASNPFTALASLRKDESWALVEAARQYRGRNSKVSERIDSLLAQARDLGVTVNEAALRDSIVFDRDDRLESVILALPYIERLEAEGSRLLAQVNEMRRKLREAQEALVAVPKLKEQNERLLARLAGKAN